MILAIAVTISFKHAFLQHPPSNGFDFEILHRANNFKEGWASRFNYLVDSYFIDSVKVHL